MREGEDVIGPLHMMGPLYHGQPGASTYRVHVSEGCVLRPLRMRRDLRDHSPTGYCWGYLGSGPAALALALCADALGDDGRALRVYQTFKAKVVAALRQDEEWTISARSVVKVCEGIERELIEAERHEQALVQAMSDAATRTRAAR